jgi:hypothetical protein
VRPALSRPFRAGGKSRCNLNPGRWPGLRYFAPLGLSGKRAGVRQRMDSCADLPRALTRTSRSTSPLFGTTAEVTPHPARPSADGLVRTPVAVHLLPLGEGKTSSWGAHANQQVNIAFIWNNRGSDPSSGPSVSRRTGENARRGPPSPPRRRKNIFMGRSREPAAGREDSDKWLENRGAGLGIREQIQGTGSAVTSGE